jgi:hypothetical protein
MIECQIKDTSSCPFYMDGCCGKNEGSQEQRLNLEPLKQFLIARKKEVLVIIGRVQAGVNQRPSL